MQKAAAHEFERAFRERGDTIGRPQPDKLVWYAKPMTEAPWAEVYRAEVAGSSPVVPSHRLREAICAEHRSVQGMSFEGSSMTLSGRQFVDEGVIVVAH